MRDQQEEAVNHDGEPLHTGDDDRIDSLTGIVSGLQEIIDADDDEYTKAEILCLLEDLVKDDCAQLDKLLIETIARERAATQAEAALQALKDKLQQQIDSWREESARCSETAGHGDMAVDRMLRSRAEHLAKCAFELAALLAAPEGQS